MSVLPNNGSIVILDDQINEAEPLIRFLSKENKSFRYFDGHKSSLPSDEGLKEAVRVLFLDYNLTSGTSGTNHIATITSNLSKIIPKNNGPYFTLLWSKNKDDAEEFENELARYTEDYPYLQPVKVKNLSKSEYFESENEAYKFKPTKEKDLKDIIYQTIGELELLEFYSHWENQVLLTSQKLLNKTSEIDLDARNLVHLLAEINLEQSMKGMEDAKLISAAYQSLNSVYSSYLNHKIEDISLNNQAFSGLSTQNSGYNVNKKRLNRWLNINTLDNPTHIGKVFCEEESFFLDYNLVKNTNNRGEFVRIAQEKKADEDYLQFIGLEISPECDVAQDKRNFYRVIPGIIISSSLMKSVFDEITKGLDKGAKNNSLIYFCKNSGEVQFSKLPKSIFCLPEFELKDGEQLKDVFMILDLSQLKTIPVTKDGDRDYLEGKRGLFSLNSDILQSIKNQLAEIIQKKGYQQL
ncbi:hypothetical protein [Streptococcus tangpeifui]|uniref:hypothetical protein n=1 Tax=Streptococcus tangpeifui TaxID=2709400 RepID=UPI0013EE04D7|nr:hypothetical protein [Streptococcus sp. ZJ373]